MTLFRKAALSFENLSLRSKYSPDIQVAVEYHIVLLQFRNEVETGMLEDSSGRPEHANPENATFDDACLAAYEARSREMQAPKKMDHLFGGILQKLAN